MFLIKYILVFILTISLVNAETKLNILNPDKIGYLTDNLFTTKKQSKIAKKLWEKEMKNHNISVTLVEIETEKKAVDLYERKEISSLLSDGLIYYKNKEKLDELTEFKWSISRSTEKFTQYYLIKNAEAILDLENINNFDISYRDEMAKIWFEYLLLKKNIKSYKTLKKMKRLKKDKNLVFDTFFNKNKMSIVSKDVYDSMLDFNPQIKDKIKIVAKSESIFFDALGMTRKDVEKNCNVDLLNLINKNKKNGLESLSFIKIQKIYILKNDDLKQTDKFFEEYNTLKIKQKK